ncbi:MAG: YHYH protein [Rubripirellula sp.]
MNRNLYRMGMLMLFFSPGILFAQPPRSGDNGPAAGGRDLGFGGRGQGLGGRGQGLGGRGQGLGSRGRGGPPMRSHRVTEKGTLNPISATDSPLTESEVTISIEGEDRVIVSNGIPNHNTGRFPNRGNPNRITVQQHRYRVPANPQVADQTTPIQGEFGVAVNGVPFDPGAAEFYDGEPGWQYEPLSGAINLGIDMSHAHVQPTGKYHYHGLPTGLIESVRVEAGSHSPLIGWAADGFPIYAVFGYSDPKNAASPVQKLTSSYRLKKGNRPGGDAPGGKYDGTFLRDYEYVQGAGDLDECNGRFTVTPEFPDGTYAYFMTEQWPVVPRNYRGTPSPDFRHGPSRGRGPSGGRGPTSRRSDGREQDAREMRRPLGQVPRELDEFSNRDASPAPQIIPAPLVQPLKLTPEQQTQLRELQRTVDQELSTILTREQRRLLRTSSSRTFPSGRSNDPPDSGRPNTIRRRDRPLSNE